MKHNNIDDDLEIENEVYDDDEENSFAAPECPICESQQECEHVVATFAVTEGTVHGPLRNHVRGMEERMEGFILDLETLPRPYNYDGEYEELRKNVILSMKGGDSLSDAFEDQGHSVFKVFRSILECTKDVSSQEYEIDESSGTWGYIRYFASDPHQVITDVNQYLLAAAEEAKSS
ncbi:MAG: hypothetical protein H0X43_13050 [Nitrosospira sp.]|nr:hypothetical protein [Nitrosospira sp.]